MNGRKGMTFLGRGLQDCGRKGGRGRKGRWTEKARRRWVRSAAIVEDGTARDLDGRMWIGIATSRDCEDRKISQWIKFAQKQIKWTIIYLETNPIASLKLCLGTKDVQNIERTFTL